MRALLLIVAAVACERTAVETDQRPLRSISVEAPGATYVVDERGQLWRKTEAEARRLVDRVLGEPAVLPDGRVVVSREEEAPGETDLFLVTGDTARPLAPAPGPDDMPAALPDGRVAFVSGRTTVASIWIADPRTDEVVQLTNVGLRAGALDGYVPPPLRRIEVDGTRLRWEAAPGTYRELEVPR